MDVRIVIRSVGDFESWDLSPVFLLDLVIDVEKYKQDVVLA